MRAGRYPNLPIPIALALLACLVFVAPAAASDVYVTNGRSDDVSHYDVSADGSLSKKSTATVDAGDHPKAIAVSPDGQSAYVANYGSNNVSQYDVGADGSLSKMSPAKVGAGLRPRGIAVSPDGMNVYVTNQGQRSLELGSGNVSQYDVGADRSLSAKSTATVDAGIEPWGIAVSPDGMSVYVTNQVSGNVSQYDVGADGSLKPKSPAAVGARLSPSAIAVSPDGKSAYVTNWGSNNVSHYIVGAGGLLGPKLATVDAGSRPWTIAVSPDGMSAYLANNFSNNVYQYDVGADGSLSAKSPATVPAGKGRRLSAIAVSPDGKSVYVASRDSNNVYQYDVGAGGLLSAKITAAVPAGDGPSAIAVRPTLVEGYASAKKTQKRKGTKIVVKVKVEAGEDLTAKGSGKVKAKKTYKLKPETKRIAEGKKETLMLKPKKSKGAKLIAKYLKRGKGAIAKLKVKLTDEAGNRKVTKLKVKLKR